MTHRDLSTLDLASLPASAWELWIDGYQRGYDHARRAVECEADAVSEVAHRQAARLVQAQASELDAAALALARRQPAEAERISARNLAVGLTPVTRPATPIRTSTWGRATVVFFAVPATLDRLAELAHSAAHGLRITSGRNAA